ncbi:CLUMA_CG017099, isoform B [Clunio marinus]|uniref:Sodium/hydrogen exchanger n=1 Tax=Clunio marinus TaxID=568069 RepID=A0A1J1IUP5_9DIPT|nr:CLUMA_CG017099, isoform B [Clunio marinus]
MEPTLEQEVKLSRRACWKGLNSSDDETSLKNCDDSFKETLNLNTIKITGSFQKLCQFVTNILVVNLNIFLLEFPRGKMTMLSKKHLITLVLINVLLINCGYANARPNLEASLNSDDAVQPQNLAPPDLSSSSIDGRSHDDIDYKTASLALVDHDSKVGHAKAGGHEVPERYPITSIDFGRVETPFIISVWILFASIAKIGFHMAPKINKVLPESSLLIVVGVIIGLILYMSTQFHVSPLTPNTFFLYLLPPIILDAGYFMPNRLFFDNIGTILLMAVIGTIFNVTTIGGSLYLCGKMGVFNGIETPFLDIFLFASLISAVDPVAVLAVFEEIHVNEILYIVVFGESLLNDAVTVVLYHIFETYHVMEFNDVQVQVQDIVNGVLSFICVAFGGCIIGVVWGFLTGLVTRFTDHVRVIEPIFVFIMAYLAYLNAEIFHWSGILAITFCGITMKNYVEANISHKSHTTIKYALKMLSSSSETIIFMFLGVATVNNNHEWNTWFIILTIVFCSVFRIIGVIILVAMANRFRIHKLSKVDQFVMSYGGLRGAVAFALVLLIDPATVKLQPLFVTTTICVIYFTVFLQGITIKPLVRILNVKRAEKRKPTMNERIHERFIDHMMAGLEDIVGKTGNYNVRDKFKRFDNRFVRPYLIRDLQGAEPKILETYSKLAMKDAMEYMRRNPSTVGQMSGTESMSALFRNYTGILGGSPSFSNFENSTRNLDMQELDYNPSKKDLTDAKIHHLLAEELKPYRRHRRLSYSRHAVDDRDLSTQVNYKMRMNIRRMAQGDRKHHKRSKRLNKDGSKQNHVSFPEFQQNGSAKQFANDYINEVLHENEEDGRHTQSDDWEGGLTFIAKPSHESSGTSEMPNNEVKRFSRDSEGENASTPTATESILPWKRGEDDREENGAIQQTEFPAWANNKEYLAYSSPSATFLGGIAKPKQNSVIGLFRTSISGQGQSGDSDSSMKSSGNTPVGRELRSASIAHTGVIYDVDAVGHAGQFPVTASHRRNTRRGSMLEVSGLVLKERRPSLVVGGRRPSLGGRRASRRIAPMPFLENIENIEVDSDNDSDKDTRL